MVQINDLDRAGEVGLCEIPDPFGPIAHDNFLYGATPAPIPGFQIDALAELFGGFDGTRVGGGARITDRVAFFIPPRLGEHASQLDLSRVGWLAVRFTLTPQGLFLHYGYTGPVQLNIQDGNWFSHHEGQIQLNGSLNLHLLAGGDIAPDGLRCALHRF